MNSNTNQDYPIKNYESITSSINKNDESTSPNKTPAVSAETNPNNNKPT